MELKKVEYNTIDGSRAGQGKAGQGRARQGRDERKKKGIMEWSEKS